MNPILYSFRRCPFAIRARFTLHYAGIEWEHREILLRAKPAEFLELSPKGTVPVLLLPDGTLLEESYDIMRWAVDQNDPESWYPKPLQEEIDRLVERNDREFKPLLDAYKYPERNETTTDEARSKALPWLEELNNRLSNGTLIGENPSLADAALFPFIRQFRGVDQGWFDNAPYPSLQAWLKSRVESERFDAIMEKHAPLT